MWKMDEIAADVRAYIEQHMTAKQFDRLPAYARETLFRTARTLLSAEEQRRQVMQGEGNTVVYPYGEGGLYGKALVSEQRALRLPDDEPVIWDKMTGVEHNIDQDRIEVQRQGRWLRIHTGGRLVLVAEGSDVVKVTTIGHADAREMEL